MDLANASVAQVLLPVKNLDDAIEFYRHTLGLPFLFTAPPQMAFFQCGSVRLLVGVPPDSIHFQPGSAIYFRVSDINEVYNSLLERGVEFQAEPHVIYRTLETDLWLAEFTDPDGNQLALMAETQAAT